MLSDFEIAVMERKIRNEGGNTRLNSEEIIIDEYKGDEEFHIGHIDYKYRKLVRRIFHIFHVKKPKVTKVYLNGSREKIFIMNLLLNLERTRKATFFRYGFDNEITRDDLAEVDDLVFEIQGREANNPLPAKMVVVVVNAAYQSKYEFMFRTLMEEHNCGTLAIIVK